MRRQRQILFSAMALVVAVPVAGHVAELATVPQNDPAQSAVLRTFHHRRYPNAWLAAQKSRRPILLFITMRGCLHCDRMVQSTYGSPLVRDMLTNRFETVYVDSAKSTTLVQKLAIRWYPTTVLVSSSGKEVDRIEGYCDASQLARRMEPMLAQRSVAPMSETVQNKSATYASGADSGSASTNSR